MIEEGTKTTNGVVLELETGGLVKVELETGEELTAHVAEEFRRVSAPVRPGDRVRVKRHPFDSTRGSIVGRGA